MLASLAQPPVCAKTVSPDHFYLLVQSMVKRSGNPGERLAWESKVIIVNGLTSTIPESACRLRNRPETRTMRAVSLTNVSRNRYKIGGSRGEPYYSRRPQDVAFPLLKRKKVRVKMPILVSHRL